MNVLSEYILYVDDERNNLLGFQTLFGKNYKVFTTDSSKRALELIEIYPFKVVITDLHLMETTGIKLAKRINNRFPEMKIMMVTGTIDPEQINSVVETGLFYSIIQMPWNYEELNNIIKGALEPIC